MILATLGTHGQPMARIVGPLEEIARSLPHLAPFHAQLGSTPRPIGWAARSLIPHDELSRLIETADIVITHGGPATIAQARAAGKVPIVVPRKRAAGEHVDDHQLHYGRRLSAAGEVILVEDEAMLSDTIANYHRRVSLMAPPSRHDPARAIQAIRDVARQLIGE